MTLILTSLLEDRLQSPWPTRTSPGFASNLCIMKLLRGARFHDTGVSYFRGTPPKKKESKEAGVLLVSLEAYPKRGTNSTKTSQTHGSGSKNRYQNGTLLSGKMDQHLRNPSWLSLSHSHMKLLQLGLEEDSDPLPWERKPTSAA